MFSEKNQKKLEEIYFSLDTKKDAMLHMLLGKKVRQVNMDKKCFFYINDDLMICDHQGKIVNDWMIYPNIYWETYK